VARINVCAIGEGNSFSRDLKNLCVSNGFINRGVLSNLVMLVGAGKFPEGGGDDVEPDADDDELGDSEDPFDGT
jgi:hypothetical protein